MTYCPECGSEVAKHDIYCPYCGIFLNTAPPAAEQKSDSISSPQIAVGTAKEQPTAVSSPHLEKDEIDFVSASAASEPLPPEAETPSAAKDNDFALDKTGADFDLNAGAAETEKTPKNFEFSLETTGEPASVTVGDSAPAPYQETESYFGSSFQPAEPEENIPQESDAASNGAQNFEVPASEEIKISKTELETPQTEDADAPNAANLSFAEEKDPFSETIPDMTSAFVNAENENRVEEKQPVVEIVAGENSECMNETEVVNSVSVPEIEKPAEELQTPEFNSSQPVFDSVRIMESKPEKAENAENAEKTAEPAPSFVESIAQTPPAATPVSDGLGEAKESRSYTTPNIGGSGDTDGKKAKLKPLDEGTILNGRYEIIRKIGGGGMGAVYLASDNNLGGVLRAVKEMVQSYIEEAQQEKAIADFKRESMILSTLDHPSIPTIYDYFYDEIESRFYLVMKYISGGDLSSRLRAAPEGKLDEKTVTEWAIQVTDVLQYLHNQPNTIVYRDLKPSNVMIDGNSGRVMLIDFGIARSVNKEEKGVTAVGTMGYAPPELFSGNVEPRSDIYSLGSTMFHLLTGADPQSNPLLIFDFQKNPRPRQINSQLSDQMEKILMRAVEYNASARFASAAELKQTLEDHLANLKTGRVTYGVGVAPVAVGLQDQPVFCGFCGQKIMATDMFCAFCGSKQPLSQKGVHSEIYAHAPVTAKLMIVGTSELDAPVFSIEKDENLVGRRDPMSNIFPEVDLSKFDPQTKISRRHARIRRDGNNFFLEDLGSSNGTIIMPAVSDSTRLLPHQPHVLSNGDKIRVGDTTLHFVIK